MHKEKFNSIKPNVFWLVLSIVIYEKKKATLACFRIMFKRRIGQKTMDFRENYDITKKMWKDKDLLKGVFTCMVEKVKWLLRSSSNSEWRK